MLTWSLSFIDSSLLVCEVMFGVAFVAAKRRTQGHKYLRALLGAPGQNNAESCCSCVSRRNLSTIPFILLGCNRAEAFQWNMSHFFRAEGLRCYENYPNLLSEDLLQVC